MQLKIKQIIDNLGQFKDLKQEFVKGRFTHAYMFISNDGMLMSDFALRFAGLFLCKAGTNCDNCAGCLKAGSGTHPDLFVYGAEKYNVKLAQAIIESSNLVPLEANFKVYIFNNFDTASPDVQNKMLKLLEEPPKNTIFIINVSNESLILPTIASRAQKIRLHRLSNNVILNYINTLTKSADEARLITNISEGNLTRAVNFCGNEAFLLNYQLCVSTLLNLTDSATMLPLAAKLNERKVYIKELLDMLEQILRDALMVRLKKPALAGNLNGDIEKIAQIYNTDMLDLIIKKIYTVKAQAERNCSINVCLDTLLLYILEVKAKYR